MPVAVNKTGGSSAAFVSNRNNLSNAAVRSVIGMMGIETAWSGCKGLRDDLSSWKTRSVTDPLKVQVDVSLAGDNEKEDRLVTVGNQKYVPTPGTAKLVLPNASPSTAKRVGKVAFHVAQVFLGGVAVNAAIK